MGTQKFKAFVEFPANLYNYTIDGLLIGDKMFPWINKIRIHLPQYFTGQWLEPGDFFHFRTEHFNANSHIFISKKYFNHIAMDSEGTALKGCIIPGVVDIDQVF